jgi:glutamate/tyrosine decarboxylase-like PLP-dependent enzyme
MSKSTPTVATHRARFGSTTRLPATGRSREDVLREIREMTELESARWEDGYASGSVYSGDREHVAFLNEVYALESQANPLHVDLWPSVVKMEAEIIAMTAAMLGGDAVGAPPGTAGGVAGTVSSGGSESILLAMKTYRDHARATRGVTEPEMVIPSSAHAAFEKAAQYFGIRKVVVPVGDDMRADVAATREALSDRTVVVVGSAPSFPYGLIDPIEELSELARERGIGFHTDACLGGFVLPWAEKLGLPVPGFDFRLRGVTSMSCDTHKFGYAAKGTSVVLYRSEELRRHQFFTSTDWPGGLYCSPSFAGSRPGALSAACWASLVTTGEDGYLRAVERICSTARAIKKGVRAIPELRVVGDPLFLVGLQSAVPDVDIYRVLDRMTDRGWSLNGLHKPPGIHLCVTLRQTQPGVAERFLADLAASVGEVLRDPSPEGGMAPLYGMANALPDRSLVAGALEDHMNGWYRIEG